MEMLGLEHHPASTPHHHSESSDGSLAFADVFVIGITAVVWGMISVCASVYYTKLLRHEARRRWPTLRYHSHYALIMPLMIFLFAFLSWPGILVWEFCARHCASQGAHGICCAGCKPCISNEARNEEKERRLETQLRLQQTLLIAMQPQNPAMEMPARQRGSSADYGGPFFSMAEVIRAKD